MCWIQYGKKLHLLSCLMNAEQMFKLWTNHLHLSCRLWSLVLALLHKNLCYELNPLFKIFKRLLLEPLISLIGISSTKLQVVLSVFPL